MKRRPFLPDCPNMVHPLISDEPYAHCCPSCLEDQNMGYGYPGDPLCCQCGGGGEDD